MIIIDKWQDYYDYAGQGRDEDIKLDRSAQTCETIAGANGLPSTSLLNNYPERSTKDQVVAGFVVVGGIGHPVAIVRRSYYSDSPSSHRWLYSARDIEAEIAQWRQDGIWRHGAVVKAQVAEVKAFVESGPRDLGLLAIEHRLISGVLMRVASFSLHERKMMDFVEWLPMKIMDTKLHDHLPAHEAHMMVSRFVGGVLTEPRNLPEISDASKIAKAGFDKQSFRTRKKTTA